MNSDRLPCLLLTSIGSRAAEAIIACLGSLRPHLRIVGLNSKAEAAALFDADVVYLGPETKNEKAFSQRLREVVFREQTNIVLPGRDEEIPLLAELAEAPWAHGVDFLIPPLSIADLFNDKYLTSQFSETQGLPFVRTAWTKTELSALVSEHQFPLVAKPRTGGHASRGVRIIFDEAQAVRLHAKGTHIFQPFVGIELIKGGTETWLDGCGFPWVWNPINTCHYIDLVFGKDGEPLDQVTVVGRRNGNLLWEPEVSHDPALLSAAALHIDALRSVGMRGPLNIQGAIDYDGVFRAFEWNARFHGSIQSYAMLGFNLVAKLLRHCLPQLQSVQDTPPVQSQASRRLHYRSVPIDWIQTLSREGRFSRQRFSGG